MSLENFTLLLGVLESPVKIIELYLAELHLVPAHLQELLKSFGGAVAGKAEVLYAAVRLLLKEVIKVFVLGVAVIAHGVLVDVVQQVEVEVLYPALSELLLKDRFGVELLHTLDDLMSGELIGKIKALPRIARKGLAYGKLGAAAVIGIGRVKVIDPARNGAVDHAVEGLLVDVLLSSAGNERETHRAEAERRELQLLEFVVYHYVSSSFIIAAA